MNKDARAALVAQVDGLPPVIARNVPKADFGAINPALQDKLAQAMAAQTQDEFALTQATPQELQARAASQEAADKAEQQREAKAQKADADKAQRDAVTQRSQAAADTFTLGGDAEQNLSGQQDIFAASSQEPATAPKTEPQKPKSVIEKMRAAKARKQAATSPQVQDDAGYLRSIIRKIPIGRMSDEARAQERKAQDEAIDVALAQGISAEAIFNAAHLGGLPSKAIGSLMRNSANEQQISAAGITQRELSLRGQKVGDFVDAVLDGKHDSQMPGGKLNKMARPYFAAQTAQESKPSQEAKPSNGAASSVVEGEKRAANQEKPNNSWESLTPEQRKRTRLEEEIKTGKTNNGGVIVNLRPSAIEKRKQELAEMGDTGKFPSQQEQQAPANPHQDRPAKWRGDMAQARMVAGQLGIKIPKNANPSDIVKAIDAHDAKAAGQVDEAKPAPKKEVPFAVGVMPKDADLVTVKDGVVYLGKHEAIDYDSGEPVTVPKGSTREDIAKALKDSGALGHGVRVYGLGERADEVMFSRQDDNAVQTGAQNDGRQSGQSSGIPQGLQGRDTESGLELSRRINADRRRFGLQDGLHFQEVQIHRGAPALDDAIQAFTEVTGTKVVVFRNLTPKIDDFNGVNFRDGTVYINENNQYPLTLVASHEWVHDMRKTHPLLFQQLRAEVVRQGKLTEYQERLRKDGETRWHDMDVVSEELAAAAVSDALTDPAFLQRLAERNTNTFKRMARAFLDFLNTLTGSWRDQKSNQYLQDVEAFRDKLAAVLDLYEAGDGQAGAGSKANFLRVWHGTPHRGIEKTGFKLNKIGTGEGAQAYGHGIYFAQTRDVAESYRKTLQFNDNEMQDAAMDAIQAADDSSTQAVKDIESEASSIRRMVRDGDLSPASIGRAEILEGAAKWIKDGMPRENAGQLYGADIPESHELLDWEKPLSEQPPQVREALEATHPELFQYGWMNKSDGSYIDRASSPLTDAELESKGFTQGVPAQKITGKEFYSSTMANVHGINAKAMSEHLQSIGIPGLRYLDGSSRADGEGTHNFVIWDESRLTPEAAKIEPMYSRSANTKAAYEARIDALFDGAKANRDGIKVLDSSDMLSLLGYKGQPVTLAESKVLQGQDNHQHMTAEVWKKVPEWLEAPAAVFDSDTVDGRLVFIAPDLVNGSPVRMIVEPNTQVGGLQVHLLVNAFDASGNTPWLRWAGDGLTRYMDKKKFPAILTPSGLQLSRVEQKAQGTGKILTEKNLAGWRKANAAQSADNAKRESTAITPANTPSTVAKVQSAIEGMFEGIADVRERIAKGTTVVQDASELPENLRQGAEDARAQALYDPYSDRVYMIASRIEAGQEKAVWLHEVFHKRGEDLLREALPRLHQAVQRWASRPTNSVERQIYEAAHARATNDGNYEAEFLSYAIEEAVNRGVQPELNGNITSAGYWLGRVREAFSKVIAKLTGVDVAAKAISAEDLVAAAYGAAGLEVAGKGGAASLRSETLSALRQEKNDQAAYDAQTRLLEKMESAEGVRVPDFLPDPIEAGVKGINEDNWVRDTADKLGEFLGVKPTHSGSRLGASSYLRYGNSEIRVSKHSKGAFNSQLYEHVTTQQDAVSLAKRVIEQRLALASELKSQRARKDEQTPEQRQFAETEKAIGGKPAYEQAKAAGKTKLNYGQWVQVRTPAFKAWFGDWEAGQKATMERRAKTLESAVEKAKAFVNTPLTNKATGLVAKVSNGNLGKMSSESASRKSTSHADHSLAIANADKLFANAVLDHSHADARGEPTIAAIHRYMAPMINADGQTVLVKMTVKETTGKNEPNPLYSIEAMEIENPPSALSRANPNGVGIRPQAGLSANVQELLAAVNTGASEITDPDTGEPMVVYHGTDWDVFGDKNQSFRGTTFLTTSERIAQGFGKNVVAAFVNVRNGLFDNFDGANYSGSFVGKAGKPLGRDVRSIVTEAKNQRRDGVYIEDVMPLLDRPALQRYEDGESFSSDWVITFDSTQIKSATGNSGAFDGSNPDIRYSRSDEPVSQLSGTEVSADISSANAVELARNWYRDNLQGGKPAVRDGFGLVQFTGKGLKELRFGLRNDTLRVKLLPAVRALIEQGEYHGREELYKPRTDGVAAFHFFSGNVLVDGVPVTAGVTVSEDANGNLFYNLNHEGSERWIKRSPQAEPWSKATGQGGMRLGFSEKQTASQSLVDDDNDVNVQILDEADKSLFSRQPASVRQAQAFEQSAPISRQNLRGIKDAAMRQIDQVMSHQGTVSLWDKTVGTMRHLGEREPAFKPVFDAAQRFIDDVAMLASEVADAAPRLLPKIETVGDIFGRNRKKRY